jgi:hypothetical protein
MRPLVCGTDDFKIETDVKIASDVVLSPGVDPNLSTIYRPRPARKRTDRGAAEASTAKLRTNPEPAKPTKVRGHSLRLQPTGIPGLQFSNSGEDRTARPRSCSAA